MRIQSVVRTRIGNAGISLLSVVTFLAIIEAVIAFGFPDAKYIVRPSVLLENYELIFTEEMCWHLLGTLARTVIGFAIASVIGISFGVLLGRSKTLAQICQPLVNLCRPIPSSILIPLLVSIPLFGLSGRTHYVTIIFGAVWPILINTADAVRHPHPTSLDAIRQLKLSRFNRLRYFTLPQAASPIFSGMKISLSICLILSITAEIIVGVETSGLGYYQEVMGKDGNYTLMYLITLVVAVLGFSVNSAFSRIVRLHPWLRHKSVDVHTTEE